MAISHLDVRVLVCCAVTAGILFPFQASAQAEESLNKCQETVFREGTRFVRERVKAVGTCLRKISAEMIERNNPDAAEAATPCVRQLRKVEDSRGIGASIEERLSSKIQAKCDPTWRPHTLEDILGPGATVSESIDADNIGAICGDFGGSGQISTYQEWIDCVVASHVFAADTAISVLFPRTLEWLDLIRPDVALVTPTDANQITDALAAIDGLNSALEGAAGDDTPVSQAGSQLLGTGQSVVYTADKNGNPGATIADDGSFSNGSALRYVDNGDGTVTDLNTGLMWEKKVVGLNCLHCVEDRYPWSDTGTDTIWDWLDDVNAESGTGLAGFSDWRIPNLRELHSIVDYERGDPAISPTFGPTENRKTWSSTTRIKDSADAWWVDFGDGEIDRDDKNIEDFNVRAVRAGR